MTLAEIATALFFLLQSQCDGARITLQLGVTPHALETICGKTEVAGCVNIAYDTPWATPVCFMYTTNDIYLQWNPSEAEGYVNDQEEPIQ